MPLWINSKPYTAEVTSVGDFLSEHTELKASAQELRSTAVTNVPAAGLLYVTQREYAVLTPDDGELRLLGSEDATTCHIVIVRHSGSAVTGLSHSDGCDTERGLLDMIDLVSTLSHGGPDGRLEVSLVGGFCDAKKTSEDLSKEILGVLQNCTENLHLVCACITDYNNRLKNEVNFPVIYGLAVEVHSGRIFPATFPDKGPEMDVRSASHFSGPKKMMNIYDNKQHYMKIGPFSWEPWDQAGQWLSLPDAIIRKYLSTSPEQEPPSFEAHVRAALKILCEHPNPEQTLFSDGQPHLYYHDDGEWSMVEND